MRSTSIGADRALETQNRTEATDGAPGADPGGLRTRSTEPLRLGLETVETARIGHRNVHGAPRDSAAPAYEVVRAERSPDTLKRLRTLDDGPAAVGDGEVSVERAAPPSIGALAQKGFATSAQPAALYLKDLTLNRSFNTFRRTNQIYLAAVTWDLSGKPPRVFPPPELAGSTEATYAMKPNETVRFVGDGIQLWPQQNVEGGLFVQLVVMESDSDLRKLGAKIEKVREAVDNSDLTAVLTAVAAGASGGTVLAVQQAARLLSKTVEGILKRNDDDLVATFHGSYGAENITEDRLESYERLGASVTLNLSLPEPAPNAAKAETSPAAKRPS